MKLTTGKFKLNCICDENKELYQKLNEAYIKKWSKSYKVTNLDE